MAITALTPDWTGRKKGIRYGIRYTQKWIKLFFVEKDEIRWCPPVMCVSL